MLADYHPPILSAPGLSDEENADMNKEIEKAMRHTIETGGPDALGVIATTVIATTVGSVVGSVAATIVSKKLDDGMVVPDNFEIEVVDGGGFFVGTEPPMPEDFDLTIISSGEI
ncbi:hypothetical protein KAJ27_24705 [bacterium]|nr:hypothetical protein [bacterium]